VEGDIISIDIGVNYKGYFGDSAWTYPVGKIDSEKQRLLTETENSLWRGLETIKAGIRLSDVSHAIEAYANKHKLGIVREMAGHGVGRQLHEAPEILNYGEPGHGPTLKVGMTLAIEPMLNLGCDEIKFGSDGWTTWTADKKASAHFEHTIVVTETGYDILTKLLEEIDETRSHWNRSGCTWYFTKYYFQS
ncbi:MAG: type I methionyl aminopeptidase, partial [Mycoplasmatales bacterium]